MQFHSLTIHMNSKGLADALKGSGGQRSTEPGGIRVFPCRIGSVCGHFEGKQIFAEVAKVEELAVEGNRRACKADIARPLATNGKAVDANSSPNGDRVPFYSVNSRRDKWKDVATVLARGQYSIIGQTATNPL